MTDVVLVETEADGVRTITWNRPERRNGWSEELEDAYYGALAAAAADEAVRAVVVTGAGTTFCQVSRVVPPDDLLAAAQAYARDVARHCAPSAVAVIAAQVRDAAESDYADALDRAYLETDKRIGSADLREGAASWLEKRPPQFLPLPAERG